MNFYVMNKNQSVLFDIKKRLKTGEEINYRCAGLSKASFGSKLLILKGNNSELTGGYEKLEPENIILAGTFDLNTNSLLKEIFYFSGEPMIIDNGSIKMDNNFNSEFTIEDLEVIKDIKEVLLDIMLEEEKLVGINKLLSRYNIL